MTNGGQLPRSSAFRASSSLIAPSTPSLRSRALASLNARMNLSAWSSSRAISSSARTISGRPSSVPTSASEISSSDAAGARAAGPLIAASRPARDGGRGGRPSGGSSLAVLGEHLGRPRAGRGKSLRSARPITAVIGRGRRSRRVQHVIKRLALGTKIDLFSTLTEEHAPCPPASLAPLDITKFCRRRSLRSPRSGPRPSLPLAEAVTARAACFLSASTLAEGTRRASPVEAATTA